MIQCLGLRRPKFVALIQLDQDGESAVPRILRGFTLRLTCDGHGHGVEPCTSVK